MSKELKPCPFCGGSKFHIKEFDGVLEDCITVHIRCMGMDCGVEIEGVGVNPDPDIRRESAFKDAVKRWNRRVVQCQVSLNLARFAVATIFILASLMGRWITA